MAEFWNRLKDSIGNVTRGMTWGQRAGLLLLLAAIVSLVAMTVNVAAAPDERLLVGAEERNRHKDIITLLATIKVEPILKNGEIWVKADDYEKATVELAAAGISSDKEIHAFLEKVNLTTTRDQFKEQVKLARQRKLEFLLGKMDAIDWARVEYTQPTQHFISMGDAGGRPTAAVSVRPAAGREITTKVAVAIAEIVAGSVEGMKREDVTVVDATTSQLIPVPGKAEQMYESFHLQELEREKAEEIRLSIANLLGPLFPRFGVAAQVKFNGDVHKRFEQTPDVDKSGGVEVLKHTLNEERFPVGYQPGLDTKGALNLDPGIGGPIVNKDEKRSELESLMKFYTDTREWKVGSDLENISISVLLPSEVFKDKAGNPIPEAEADAHRRTVEAAVIAAAGYGDPKKLKVTVGVMPSFLPPPELIPVGWYLRVLEHLENNATTYLLFLLSVASLWLIYRFMRAAIEKKRTEELEKTVTRAVEETPEFKDWEEAEAVAERLRAQIREMVSKNPRAVAGVIKRWMGQH